jgi:thiamine-phosphate pyrophosphorylase
MPAHDRLIRDAMKPIAARLCLLFTPDACSADPWRTLEESLAGGIDLVQWRVKTLDRDGARRCRDICRAHGVPIVVNDHCELAAEIGADGVHVGQDDAPVGVARRIVGPHRLVGVSTHDLAQVRAADAAGADYLGFGPMFPTSTKGYLRGQPAGALRDAAAATARPIFAIGGITAPRVAGILAAGVERIAVSSAILAAASPRDAARELWDRVFGGQGKGQGRGG